MRYGLCLANVGTYSDPRTVVAVAEAAEEAGWEALLVWDHLGFVWGPPAADPWVTLAAVGARTSSLVLGTNVTPVPRRRSHVLAHQVATLDVLSGGRAVLGAGIGGIASEFTSFGEDGDARLRAEMLDEGLEVLRALWSGDRVDHHGRHYTVDGVTLSPAPVQPRLPIWIGGNSARALRRAARHDGWAADTTDTEGMTLSPEDVARSVETVRALREGDDSFDVVVMGHVERGDSETRPRMRRRGDVVAGERPRPARRSRRDAGARPRRPTGLDGSYSACAMPEGDALHRAARRLQPLVGERLEVETPNARARVGRIAERLDGRRLLSVEAVGKGLFLRFEGGYVLHSHLRMTGRWSLVPRGSTRRGQPWLVLRGSRYEAVQWNGPVLELHARALGRLGPDILERPPRIDEMVARIRRDDRARAVGDALLDQRLVAGIGNKWRSEALWAAGVSPWRPLANTTDAELGMLLEAAARLMSGSLEGRRHANCVYRRTGRPCPRCGSRIVSRGQGDANRTAYWCSACQR